LLLTIEKMIYGGDGLARLPANDRGPGKAAFVPFVLAGEAVEAAIAEEKPGYVRAQAEAIVRPSPHRIQPQCPYFGVCGGCHYQHASYDHQLEIKKDILRESLRRFAKLELGSEIEVHPSPPWNYRNRSRLQVRVQPEFAAGYFKLGSHELMAVEQCPISSPLINLGISALWQSGRAGNTAEGVREIEFFANADDTKMLVEISCAREARRAAVRAWAEELRAALPEIVGVVAFRAAQAGAPATEERVLALGESSLIYETQLASYRVSAGAFFQTNRHLTDELVKIVAQGRRGELALDLYAGVGLFSTALARDVHHIVAVESSQLSAGDLAYNLSSKGEVIQASTEQYLSRLEKQGRAGKGISHNFHTPDLAVVDPPRSGLGERVARILANLGAPRVTYVSCDPATLARDLVPLLAAGYRVEQAHLVDLFPQTYHLESVLHLVRG
jgi:23S rRNA (uracil1939-C5)-methyltransferase